MRALPGLLPTFLVVALLACVLVPLPTVLVDLLLSVSLAGAVLLIVASLGIRRTSDFLNFPSLLLLVTLFRLALNVSTTRLILSQADAGRVVDAFAGFVVRDDLIVGGVMFAIITIVQYLVIARGAERVAEVSARFALDALPGHQAAIEADLRAGLISARQAAQRRASLTEKSRFYGAMDGAVRFVKGDAVAGLAITGINLAGGLAIGVGRGGYTVSQSLDIYGRLTIGDGLLAQIPALLVSLAAGVLVSRVDRESDAPARLARWLEPAMLVVPAVMLAVLALIPAMPSLAFLSTATALVTAAFVLAGRLAESRARQAEADAPRELRIAMAPADAPDERRRTQTLAAVGASCADALGMEIPPLRLQPDPTQPRGRIEVRFGDRLLARARLDEASGEAPTEEEVAVAAFRAVMDHAAALIDLPQLTRALEEARATHPEVVQRALDGLDAADLLEVLRSLLRERVPLPPLTALLAALAETRSLRDPSRRAELSERMREHLAPHWLPAVLDAMARLGPVRWVRLEAEAEADLLAAAQDTGEGVVLTLSTDERDDWWSSIVRDTTGPVVVITTPQARRAAARLLERRAPPIPVISTAELARTELAPDTPPAWIPAP